jgi:5-methylthioadenosine/S-adenosylhomocysteine deaminase
MENRKEAKMTRRRIRFAVLIFYFLFSIFAFLANAQAPPAAKAPAKQRADLLITSGTIVTMDAGHRIIEDGAIAVRGGVIVAIGPTAEIVAQYTGARSINASGRLILPGLINTHNHAPMTLLRGLADDLTLQEWLEKYIFPAEAKNVTEDFVTWGTRLAVLEMIRGGTTTYADMYYFEDAIARATKAAGMRGVLGETWIDFPAPDNKTHAEAIAYTESFLKKWQGDPLIHAAVAPHAAFTNSEASLKDAAALARRYGAPILIHVSETKRENDEIQAKYGASPVAYLDRIGFLGPDVLAAHCVWLDAADIATLVKRDVGCAHNPSSNMMLASGVAPVGDMLRAGLRLGLGTDGPAGSNNDLNMMEEMDLAAKLQKVSRMDPRALSAEQALELATIGGARALHMEKEIGSLETGKKADIILLRTDLPHAVPSYNLYSSIVYTLKASDVVTVIINGRTVMLNRRVLTLNEPGVLAKAMEYAQKVKQSLAAPPK